jgi:transcription initiation factor TFIIH subunit 4
VWYPKESRFYISRTMQGILTEKLTDVEGTKKFIIVETNFRVYAYTSTEIEILILSFFMEMEMRLPGFVVGYITRNSVRNALKSGLSVTQI